MTQLDSFDRTLSMWLDERAGPHAPDYLADILATTAHVRQRPSWSSLVAWLPPAIGFRARWASTRRPLRFIALLVALAVVAALLAVAGVGRRGLPHFGAKANGLIAFVDGSSIRIAEADGTVRPLFIVASGGADQLTYSPDGTKIAFRAITAGAPSIMVADSSGTQPARVVADASLAPDGPIAWSSDSRRIALNAIVDGIETIEIVDADSGRVQHLSAESGATPLMARNPAWSPDGQWISFVTTPVDGSGSAVNVIHPDGSGARALNLSPLNEEGLAWSPDPRESRLAYVARDPQGRCSTQGCGVRRASIKAYDLVTAEETTIAETSILTGSDPVWSPDGTQISWWNGGVYIVNVDEAVAGHGRPRMILPAVTNGCQGNPDLAGKAICGSPQWSPDGQWVFGVDVLGKAVVFGRVDGSSPPHAITLDHPVDYSQVSGWQAAWQAVAP